MISKTDIICPREHGYACGHFKDKNGIWKQKECETGENGLIELTKLVGAVKELKEEISDIYGSEKRRTCWHHKVNDIIDKVFVFEEHK